MRGARGEPARAQIIPVSLEARLGGAFPGGRFSDFAGSGYSVGGAVHFQLHPGVSVYGGYDHARFGYKADAEDTRAHVTDAGFRAGLRAGVPFAGVTAFRPWLEGGATLNRTSVSVENTSGVTALSISSNRPVGWEVGAGLDLSVAPRITIAPAARYRSHTADFHDPSGEPTNDHTKVNYLTAELTVRVRL